MSFVKTIRIKVVARDGEPLLEETHDISFGAEGLLLVPQRLGVAVNELVCFPSKEHAIDLSNMGAPLSAVCAALHPTAAESIAKTFSSAGFTVVDKSLVEVWIRTNSVQKGVVEPPTYGSNTSTNHDSATTSRLHLQGPVRDRMKDLCNKICPRCEHGFFVPERAHFRGGMKRPTWCIEMIMDALDKEFEPSKLEGVRGAAIRHMARASKSFQSLKSLSDDDWASMTSESKERNLRLLHNFERDAALWRQSPYGVLWEQDKITRRPTPKEVSELAERLAQHESFPTER